MNNQAVWLGGTLMVSLVVVGCSTVAVGPGPHTVVAMEPVGDEISKYPSDHRPVDRGELLEFQFNSGTSNLRSIANWLGIHHLYFDVAACASADERTLALFSGNVHEVPTTDGIEIPRRYRAYIPLDLKQLIQQASVDGTLNVEAQLDQARANGLCLRVGGGTMWGGTLNSNSIRLPLAVERNELHVSEAASTGGAVSNVRG